MRGLSELQFEKMKCDNCGKFLGYIHIRTKSVPPREVYRLYAGVPVRKLEVTTFCPECYHKAQTK